MKTIDDNTGCWLLILLIVAGLIIAECLKIIYK